MQQLHYIIYNIPQGEYVLIMSHYPILTVTGTWEGGQHKDHIVLKDLFYKHRDKVKGCLSGHQHLLDRAGIMMYTISVMARCLDFGGVKVINIPRNPSIIRKHLLVMSY
ncbi:hypothetical protein [Chryseobacterium paludis]|uniref:hypothetical protein n=1 Tax=Chryseobacterium paludis TaxID=2956784 RepID=UPI0021C1834E|nr:hypothetical protein [Chryseobacterium paludis]